MNLKDLIKNAYFNGASISDIAVKYDISEERVLEILGFIKFDEVFQNQKICTHKYIKLQCIQERPNWALTIRVGEIVYADISSLRIDSDGDAFMEVYNSYGKYFGVCNMKRFKSVM